MKVLMMVMVMGLMGCDVRPDLKYTELQNNTYIVTGQSNAERCDWSHFEAITGSTVINISVGGYSIESLIA